MITLLKHKYGFLPDSDWVIYLLLMVSAAFMGWGQSLYWVAGNKYVNDCANNENKGLFNSIFWVANMGSLLTGNLMAAFVIPNTSIYMFYSMMTALCFFSMFYFMFLKTPLP